jgi:hypothetical protein
MMTRGILLGAAIALLATGCTSRMEAVGQAGQPKTRTYTTHVKPVTISAKCLECHQTDPAAKGAPKGLGTYSVDRPNRAGIRTMLTDARYAKDLFTAEEIQNVLDWIAAGAPDDAKAF